MARFTNKDICQLVAQQLGFDNDEQSNLSEWYAFKNQEKCARFKVAQSPDGKGNYNFYANHLCDDICDDIYAILVGEKIFVIQIDCECFGTTKAKKFVLSKNDILHMASQNSKSLPNLSMELDWNEEILIKINDVNVVFDRISQRSNKVDKSAIGLLLQGEKKCYYCGINQDQINKLDDLEKEKQIDDSNIQSNDDGVYHGLTKRPRKTLEVDQKDPHGGYKKGNIVLACSWCNNAKTDTFTCDEFKSYIAPGIRNLWNSRLKKAKPIVCIPDDSIEVCVKDE